MRQTNLKMGQGMLLASVTFWSLIIFMGCQSADGKLKDVSIERNDTIVPAIIHRLADLPDSLKPKEIFMADRPGPIEIPVPFKEGSFSYLSHTGIPIVLPQEPPATKSLPLLVNNNGDTVLGADGQPLLLGNGGKSFFTHFNSDDGLPLDGVSASLIDSKGNYWLGTLGAGLSRFDGKKFTSFNSAQGLAGSVIYCLAEDKKGYIWIGTDNGLSKYDGRSFKNYDEHEGLKNIIIDVLENDDGTLWIATNLNGLIRFGQEGGHGAEKILAAYDTTNGLRNQSVFGLVKDNAGKLWFGNRPGLSRLDGETFTHFTPDDGQGLFAVHKIVKARSGNFWLGTTRGLYYFNPNGTGTLLPFTNDSRLSGKWIRSLYEASNGKLWIGTADDGLHVFDGNEFTTFNTANGLPNSSIYSIQEDKDGHIWIGTNGGGISVFKDPSFSNFTNEHGFPYTVWGFLEASDGTSWYTTYGGGIAKKQGHVITYYGDKQGLLNGLTLDIHKDSLENIWVGYRGGFGLFDGKSFRSYTWRIHGLAGSIGICFIPAAGGGYWVGTDQGLSRVILEKDKQTIYSLTNYKTEQGLSGKYIRSIKEDYNKHIWISTVKGLNYFDGNSFRIFNQAHGLPDEFVSTVCFDSRGNIWVGTDKGLAFADSGQLARFMNGNQPGIRFHSYSTSDGLPDNTITSLIELPEGKIVAGTNEGIAMFDLPDAKAREYDKLNNLDIFNASTGYPVRDVNTGPKSLTLDSEGVLWIATGSDRTNLVRFDYRALKKNKKPTKASIHRLFVNEDPFPWSILAGKTNLADTSGKAEEKLLMNEMTNFGRTLSRAHRDSLRSRFNGIRFDSILPFSYLPQKLVLPYRHNQVSFEFGSNELANPGMVEYQYMLEGYNSDWSSTLKQTKATFGNISEGTHTFKVRARFTGAGEADSKEWSEEARFTFRILPPLYRSWWAYTLYAMLIGLVIWRVHLNQKMRTIRKVREADQAKELAQAREIEKAYSRLKMTQQQLVQSEKMASLGELTAGIAHEIQNPLNFVNNFSEVNKELTIELEEEIDKGNYTDAKAIAKDIRDNEEKINHHGKRADAIVKGMLQHSRSSSGQKEPTDINALADEYLRLAYHGLRAKDKSFNATMKTNFDENIGNINIIPQDIGRVILNLINNAFYAVNEKNLSTVPIATGSPSMVKYEPTVSVSTKKIKDKVEISVNDNANGIPQKVLDKIFQPFFTTKPTGQGTGLGLSLSYDIIKTHGGELTVETVTGQGATFTISIPV